MLRLFIGYDPREAVVYHVCVNSIVRHASQPVAVTPLALNNLTSYIEHHRDGSNQFTYSRFLVPYLTNWSGWALYVDGDMLLREDIAGLFKLKDRPRPSFACTTTTRPSSTRNTAAPGTRTIRARTGPA